MEEYSPPGELSDAQFADEGDIVDAADGGDDRENALTVVSDGVAQPELQRFHATPSAAMPCVSDDENDDDENDDQWHAVDGNDESGRRQPPVRCGQSTSGDRNDDEVTRCAPRNCRCCVLTLPVEIWHAILLFLPAVTVVSTIQCVCGHLKRVCDVKCLWRMLTYRCFPMMAKELEAYCDAFVEQIVRESVSSTVVPKRIRVHQRRDPHADESSLARPCGRRFIEVRSAESTDATAALTSPDRLSSCRSTAVTEALVGLRALRAMDRHMLCKLFDQSLLLQTRIPVHVATQMARQSILRAVRWKDAYHNLPLMTRIAVCDQRNDRVKVMCLDGHVLDIISGIERVPGPAVPLPPDMGSANAFRLSAPSGIARIPGASLVAVTLFSGHSVAILDLAAAAGHHFVRVFPVGFLPRGIAVLPNGNLVVCLFGGSTVSMFTVAGEWVGHIRCRFSGPSGVAVLPDGCIAVSECNSSVVVILDPLSSAVKRRFGEDSGIDFAEPRGIAYLSRQDCLAVCDSGKNRLVLLDYRRGVALSAIEGPFDCLASIAVTPDGHHAVLSDCDNHRLLVVRLSDGRLLHQLGSGEPGNEDSELYFPRCLCVLPGLV